MNSCNHCRYAEWTLTKNGRINPHKVGQCGYELTLHVPLSYQEGPLVIRGGYIWRKRPKEKCPTFPPIETRA
jgi:hypothetical protein